MKNHISPQVSVIIPVYNVEQYLEKCVRSVIKQTLQDIEIILVDDGSTDSSLDICNCLKKIDNRIHVIHKANGGLSSARNAGLDIALGKYVYFLDSDDWILPNTLQDMLNLITKHDIVIGGIEPFFIGKKEPIKFQSMVKYCDVKHGLSTFLNKQFTNFPAIACNKLYKKSIVDKYSLRFDEGLIHEDESWAWYYCTKIKSGIFTPNKYYKYLIRATSITGAKTQQNHDIIDIIHNIYKHLKKYNLYPEYKRLFNNWAGDILKSLLESAYETDNSVLQDLCVKMVSILQIDLDKPKKLLKRLFSMTITCDKKYKQINILGFSIKRKIDC